MNEAIYRTLQNIIHTEMGIPPKQLTPQTNLVSELGADSIDTLNIINAIDAELKIKLVYEQLNNIETLEALCALIESKKSANPS